MKYLAALLVAALFFAGLPATATDAGDEILGTWNTTGNDSKVEIFKVKNKYAAKIISLKEPNWPANDEQGMSGKPKNDRNNPNPELRNRPIVGLQIMQDFVPAGKNLWEQGKIYDPESGKTYKCKMKLISTNRLEVHGYVGFSLLGRTVTWTR
ncbi:MAG: hypothetical protein JWR19_2321 [Pedosphaera sp.]|nr:hypothetical protein [Pedosphaera sp.]